MPKAIRFHETGGPSVLRLEDVAVGAPGAGEARVRHTAIGVNFIDVYHRSGLYPLPLPSGVGVDAAGVVEAVGAGVTHVRPGDRVGYVASAGTYAEERVVQAGDPVLVHAAAGGVGLLMTQWLKALGATVIATVGSDEKAKIVRAHGADHAIVYTREDFPKRVREITGGEGVAVAYDSVGKATFEGSLDSLRPLGLMVTFGNASGPPPLLDVGVLGRKGSLFLTRPTIFSYIARREDLEQAAAEVFEIVRSGKVKVEVSRTWPLAQAAEAHRALEGRQTTGSLVLLP